MEAVKPHRILVPYAPMENLLMTIMLSVFRNEGMDSNTWMRNVMMVMRMMVMDAVHHA